MLMVAGITFVLAAIYFLLLRCCIGVIVWLSILLVFTALLVIGAFLHWSSETQFQEDNDEDTRKSLFVLAIVFYVLAGLFLIYILYMCNKIRLAIAIMKAGTLFIKDVWYSIFVPIGFFIVTVAIFCYWVVASVFIYATGDIDSDGNGGTAEVEWDDTTRNAFWFHAVGIFWVVAFMIAFEQFVLASTVCIWYYSHKSDAGVQRPIS